MKYADKIKVAVIALLFGFTGGVLVLLLNDKPKSEVVIETSSQVPREANLQLASSNRVMKLPDFTEPAEKALPSVVFIKTEFFSDDYITSFFYGGSQIPMQGHGSGVIISPDGYIVTNNHVIANAANITVMLSDKREFNATLVGQDPRTDLALLKIEADSLKMLPFGNSDELKIGEWVLAIGNPFNLTSTVTAGIVSAKARDIGSSKQDYAVESFIQTDAAVNPGNSGGALINVSGQLVGINTAIASPTGSYAGYSFAVPASIVKKAVQDFMQFGSIQRAFLGVKIANINKTIAEKYNLVDMQGVFISAVTKNGAAYEAGIEPKDVILKLNNTEISEVSQLLDLISRYRPGDKVILTVRHAKKIRDCELILKNEDGGTTSVIRQSKGILGAVFEDLSENEKMNYGINYGVKVADISSGKFLSVGLKRGMIILKVNDVKIYSTDDLERVINGASGGVYIEGYDPQMNAKIYFAFGTDN